MTSRSHAGSRHVEPPPGSIVQVLHCSAESGRRRLVVVPSSHASARGLRRLGAWLLLVPLVVVPRAMQSDDELPLESSERLTVDALAGEVDGAALDASAEERFMTWEARFHAPGNAGTPADRRTVARGIGLLADALDAAAPSTGERAGALSAMRRHGAQLARGDTGDYAAYADAGHVHAALGHAARLLAALPGVPGGVAGELAAAADAVGPRPLAYQGAVVRAFFSRAATVLAASAAP